jgi:glycosyltransferase involved in cell wall biosynthesis
MSSQINLPHTRGALDRPEVAARSSAMLPESPDDLTCFERGARQAFPADPVRIIYIIDHLCNIRAGGELALFRILRHLPRERFQPSVVTFAVQPLSVQLLRELDCPLHVFPIERTYDWRGLTQALRLRRLLAIERPSIVHTFFETSNTWGGLITKLSFGPKLISSRRDMGVLRQTKHRFAYKLINALSDRVMAVSEEVRKLCIEQDKVAAQKVSVVYNGVDLDLIDRCNGAPDARRNFGLDRASHIVTTVANIRRIKGLDVFIKAAASLHSDFPSAAFVIAGWPNEPQYFTELQQLVADLGLENNVFFLGEVEDIFPLLKASDAFCLLSRSEGFSNALLEAMACRLPCVATRVGGNAEAVTDGHNGYIVPVEDPQTAADRLRRLLKSSELAMRMGQAARITIQSRFTTEHMIRQLTQCYLSVT